MSNGLIRTDSLSWEKAIRWLKRKFPKIKDTTTKTSDMETKPRTKADLAVRRLKLEDITSYIPSTRDTLSWIAHLDTILATNILIWTEVFGFDRFMQLKTTGMFNNLETFIEMSSAASTEFKRYPKSDGSKYALAELNVLTGYLQSDIEETDWTAKLAELAHGGETHGICPHTWKTQFDDTCSLVIQRGRHTSPKFRTLFEYIQSGDWITPGSSSIGSVKWSYDGKVGKFRARKNMLEELYTPIELYRIVMKWNGQLESKAFTKDELSKRRIAVASNIESYLVEAYILSILGHIYKGWNYITLDESPVTNHQRTSKVMQALGRKEWALPFDFKNFDHQPTTYEIETIIMHCQALADIPLGYKSKWTSICSKMLHSYRNNTITMTMGGKHIKLNMTGGLPSGVRWTSLLGNIWNCVMTTIARNTTASLLGTDMITDIGIRGDDTYILSRNPSALLLFRYAYAAINAIGADSKFGIAQNVCEFLRTEISPTEVNGWPNRAIPSITQRKPWNPEPWEPGSEATTLAANIYMLERRSKRPLPQLHHANMSKWSKFTGLSPNWLSLPKRLGGFGIYEYTGKLTTAKLPRPLRPQIQFSGLTPAPPLKWINLTEQELLALSNTRMLERVASDDIPGPQPYFAREYIAQCRKVSAAWTQDTAYPPKPGTIRHPNVQPPQIADHVFWPSETGARYDDWNDMTPMEFIQQYQQLVRSGIEKLQPMVWYLENYYTEFYRAMRYWERRGWHRTDAIDLARGFTPIEPVRKIHPILTAYIKESVSRSGLANWLGRKSIARNLTYATKDAITTILASVANNCYNY